MSKSLHSEKYSVIRRMLTELRTAGGLSQLCVAEAMGAPQSFVSKYETGERRLDFAELMDLLAILGADPHGFVDRYLAATRVANSRVRLKAPAAGVKKTGPK